MMNYIQGERIKLKRSFSLTLIWLIPLLNIMFSFLMNPSYFITNTFNWWSILFMPLAIALWCSLSNNKEKQAGNYNRIFLLPVSFHQVWTAKMIVVAVQALCSLIVFLVMMTGLSFILPNMPHFEGEQLEGVMLIWFTSLWEIPLALYLSKKWGMIAAIIVNFIGGCVLGIAISTGSLWWLNPWSWSIRSIMPIIGVHPNGTILPEHSLLRDDSVILMSVLLAAAFLIVITVATSFAFVKRVPGYGSAKGES